MKEQSFLIADDSVSKITFLTLLLEKEKWKGSILIARTTEEAIALIDEHENIAFAFVDYYIPHHNGPAVIRHLKEKNPQARIALVSSSDNQQNADEAKRKGAEAVVCASDPEDQVEGKLRMLLNEWIGV